MQLACKSRYKLGFNPATIQTYRYFSILSAQDLWDDWERGKVFDALFLDTLNSSTCPASELAQRIRCADPNIPIIFVTNSNRYLIQGYEVSAYRYLLKPIRQEEISACLDYCYQFTQTMLHDGFTIMRKGLTVRLPYRDVLYIMSGVHSIYIYTRLGQTYHIPLKGTFAHYASTFPPSILSPLPSRIHRKHHAHMSVYTKVCQAQYRC